MSWVNPAGLIHGLKVPPRQQRRHEQHDLVLREFPTFADRVAGAKGRRGLYVGDEFGRVILVWDQESSGVEFAGVGVEPGVGQVGAVHGDDVLALWDEVGLRLGFAVEFGVFGGFGDLEVGHDFLE